VLAYAERATDVTLSYSLGGKLSATLAASHSVLGGQLAGPALPLQGAWFWESSEVHQLAEFRDGVALGADLERGVVRLKLKNETRTRLWLTLVLVGQGETPAEGVQHFWALEDR
ncbi:MAG TPA: hypothetical protein VJU61_24855, partial [Polyangiaceae bacterium]|nr:hypothetical protein [Polyangiaceae bacterium]